MTARKDFVAAVRRRAIELLLVDDGLDLHAAERQAVKELREIAKLQSSLAAIEHLQSPSKRKQLGGARARLGVALSNMAARMATAASITPRALSLASTAEAPPVGGGERTTPDERNPLAPAAAHELEPPSDVLLIYAGGNAGGARLIPEAEYPPALQSVALRNWRASIEANRRRGSS
jgi:hypothetical protein